MDPIKPSAAQIEAAATLRLENALRRIERAQNDLAYACGELSTLVGGSPSWKATSAMTDRVKALWYKVHNFRMGGRFTLDPMHIEALERALAKEQNNAKAFSD